MKFSFNSSNENPVPIYDDEQIPATKIQFRMIFRLRITTILLRLCRFKATKIQLRFQTMCKFKATTIPFRFSQAWAITTKNSDQLNAIFLLKNGEQLMPPTTSNVQLVKTNKNDDVGKGDCDDDDDIQLQLKKGYGNH